MMHHLDGGAPAFPLADLAHRSHVADGFERPPRSA
jgi:hypothetical protein